MKLKFPLRTLYNQSVMLYLHRKETDMVISEIRVLSYKMISNFLGLVDKMV